MKKKLVLLFVIPGLLAATLIAAIVGIPANHEKVSEQDVPSIESKNLKVMIDPDEPNFTIYYDKNDTVYVRYENVKGKGNYITTNLSLRRNVHGWVVIASVRSAANDQYVSNSAIIRFKNPKKMRITLKENAEATK